VTVQAAETARERCKREPIVVRALRRGDAALVGSIHERLGARSREQRYLGAKPALSAGDLARLAGVDGRDRVAVVALAGWPAAPIGIARYARAGEVEVAEIAMEVVDEWQRRGVGRVLLAELRTRALRAGVRRFTWTAFASNRAVVALSRGARDRRCIYLGDGVMRWSATIR
jgi:GNAT superfamily N-acetyltransferase